MQSCLSLLQSGLFCGKELSRASDELRNSQSCDKSTWLTGKSVMRSLQAARSGLIRPGNKNITPWHYLARDYKEQVYRCLLSKFLCQAPVSGHSPYSHRDGCPSFIVLDNGQSPLFRLVINPNLT